MCTIPGNLGGGTSRGWAINQIIRGSSPACYLRPITQHLDHRGSPQFWMYILWVGGEETFGCHARSRDVSKKCTNPPSFVHFNPLTARLFNLNFHPLEVVSRWRDPQLQASENYSDLTKWSLSIFIKICWLMSRYIFNMFKMLYLMC